MLVPTKRTVVGTAANQMEFEISAIRPDGGVEVTATMGRECFDALQRVIAGDRHVGFAPVQQIDFLARAKIGDHEPLIRHFEKGGDITEDERRVIVALARDEWHAPENCPPKIETEVNARDVARFAAVLKLLGGKRIPDIAARKFGIDRSYVSKLVKKYGRHEGFGGFALRQLCRAGGADEATAQRVMSWFANITEDDMREATERKRKGKVRKKLAT